MRAATGAVRWLPRRNSAHGAAPWNAIRGWRSEAEACKVEYARASRALAHEEVSAIIAKGAVVFVL